MSNVFFDNENRTYINDDVSTPIPVRLSDGELARLDAIAARLGLKRASLMRLWISNLVDFLAEKKELSLPLDFEKIMAELDGRTVEFSKAQNPKLTQHVGNQGSDFSPVRSCPPDFQRVTHSGNKYPSRSLPNPELNEPPLSNYENLLKKALPLAMAAEGLLPEEAPLEPIFPPKPASARPKRGARSPAKKPPRSRKPAPPP